MIASRYSYGQRSSTPRSISCPSVSGGIQSTRQPSAMPWPSSAVNSGPRRLLQARGINETHRNSQPTCSTAFCLSPVGRPDLQSQAEGSGGGDLGFRGRRVGGDFDPIGEPDTVNELGQLARAIEPAPAFLRRVDQLEHYCERRFIGEAALRADRTVPHGGKGAFDRIRGPQVFPVFGGEIAECEQGM